MATTLLEWNDLGELSIPSRAEMGRKLREEAEVLTELVTTCGKLRSLQLGRDRPRKPKGVSTKGQRGALAYIRRAFEADHDVAGSGAESDGSALDEGEGGVGELDENSSSSAGDEASKSGSNSGSDVGDSDAAADDAGGVSHALDDRLGMLLLSLVHMRACSSRRAVPQYKRLRTVLDWTWKVCRPRSEFGQALGEQGSVGDLNQYLEDRGVVRSVQLPDKLRHRKVVSFVDNASFAKGGKWQRLAPTEKLSELIPWTAFGFMILDTEWAEQYSDDLPRFVVTSRGIMQVTIDISLATVGASQDAFEAAFAADVAASLVAGVTAADVTVTSVSHGTLGSFSTVVAFCVARMRAAEVAEQFKSSGFSCTNLTSFVNGSPVVASQIECRLSAYHGATVVNWIPGAPCCRPHGLSLPSDPEDLKKLMCEPLDGTINRVAAIYESAIDIDDDRLVDIWLVPETQLLEHLLDESLYQIALRVIYEYAALDDYSGAVPKSRGREWLEGDADNPGSTRVAPYNGFVARAKAAGLRGKPATLVSTPPAPVEETSAAGAMMAKLIASQRAGAKSPGDYMKTGDAARQFEATDNATQTQSIINLDSLYAMCDVETCNFRSIEQAVASACYLLTRPRHSERRTRQV